MNLVLTNEILSPEQDGSDTVTKYRMIYLLGEQTLHITHCE